MNLSSIIKMSRPRKRRTNWRGKVPGEKRPFKPWSGVASMTYPPRRTA